MTSVGADNEAGADFEGSVGRSRADAGIFMTNEVRTTRSLTFYLPSFHRDAGPFKEVRPGQHAVMAPALQLTNSPEHGSSPQLRRRS
jgi:hypothetical protein